MNKICLNQTNYFQPKHMATYVVGAQKTRLNETLLLSTQNIMALYVSILFQTLRSGQVRLIDFAQAVRIIYAKDRAQMNRNLN